MACLAVPVVQQFDLLPHLSLNLFSQATPHIESATTNGSVFVTEQGNSSALNMVEESQLDTVSQRPKANQLSESSAIDSLAAQQGLAAPVAQATPQAVMWFTWTRLALIAKCTYLAIVALLAAMWAVGSYLRWTIVWTAQPAEPRLVGALRDVAGCDVRGTRLLVSDRVSSPAMWGISKPTIVIPRSLASQSAENNLRFGLAHEWSHVIRGDYLAHAICRLTKFVCFYQPVYWWMRNQLALSQDYLADAYAAEKGSSVEDYAGFLVSLARGRSSGGLAGMLCMAQGKSRLLQRVTRLVRDSRPIALRASRTSVLLTGFCASLIVVTLGAVRLSATPTVVDDKALETKKGNAEKPADDLPKPITYTGTVVDRDTGKPIAGATVKVWHDLNRDPKTGKHVVLEKTDHPTDEAGRYSFTLPPEQVAEPSLYLEVEAFHPDYHPKGRSGYSHSMIVKNLGLGEPPFFDKIELAAGERVKMKVKTPTGKPAAGLMVNSYTKAHTTDPGFSFEYGAWYETETDEQGELSLMVPKGGDGVIWVYAKEFAATATRIGKKRGQLDDLTLQPGTRLNGRVVNARGEAVPNVGVEVERNGDGEEADEFLNSNAVSNGIRAAGMTDEQGRFSLAPLPTGEYTLKVEGRNSDPTIKREAWIEEMELADVFSPMQIVIEAGVEPRPIEVRAVPHVIVRGRFFDAQGKPRASHKQHMVARDNGQFIFAQSSLPGADGWFEFKFPHGADDATVNLMTNEHSALRWRLSADKPLQYGREIKLGKLEEDFTTLEIVRYDAAILLIKAINQDGDLVKDAKPKSKYATPPADERMGRFVIGGDISFELQPDGRWRSSQMLPDDDVTISFELEGYTSESKTVSLKEGETREVEITVSKKAAGN